MQRELPSWAMRTAAPEDFDSVRDAYRRGTMKIRWPVLRTLRDWAKLQGWPTPRFGFEQAFVATMLDGKTNYELAIHESGIELHIPKRDYTLSVEMLRELDEMYAERSPTGRPIGWGRLVEELREIRRAVEAGTIVTIQDAQTLQTWQDFYAWAHGRYHMLEDGSDKWIGDDNG